MKVEVPISRLVYERYLELDRKNHQKRMEELRRQENIQHLAKARRIIDDTRGRYIDIEV